jgi:hypothetical protein
MKSLCSKLSDHAVTNQGQSRASTLSQNQPSDRMFDNILKAPRNYVSGSPDDDPTTLIASTISVPAKKLHPSFIQQLNCN